MAFYRGEEGAVKFKNSSSDSIGTVAATRSWSFSLNKDVLDCTVQGATSRSYRGGFIDGSGSCELLYTAGASTTQEYKLLQDILTTNDTADAQFQLFLDSSDAGNKKIEFNGIVTGAEFGSNIGDLTAVTINFQMSGAVTANDF